MKVTKWTYYKNTVIPEVSRFTAKLDGETVIVKDANGGETVYNEGWLSLEEGNGFETKFYFRGVNRKVVCRKLYVNYYDRIEIIRKIADRIDNFFRKPLSKIIFTVNGKNIVGIEAE